MKIPLPPAFQPTNEMLTLIASLRERLEKAVGSCSACEKSSRRFLSVPLPTRLASTATR